MQVKQPYIHTIYIYNIPYTITSKFTICTEVNLTISSIARCLSQIRLSVAHIRYGNKYYDYYYYIIMITINHIYMYVYVYAEGAEERRTLCEILYFVS